MFYDAGGATGRAVAIARELLDEASPLWGVNVTSAHPAGGDAS